MMIRNVWSHKDRAITDKAAVKCQIWIKFFQLLMGWIHLLPGSRVLPVWFGVLLGQVKPSWKPRRCPETYTLVNIPLSLFRCQISDLWNVTDWKYAVCYSCWTPGNYSCVCKKNQNGKIVFLRQLLYFPEPQFFKTNLSPRFDTLSHRAINFWIPQEIL